MAHEPATKPKLDPIRLFKISFALGITLLFVTPPFHVPDEQFHFFRSFQISEGRLLSKKFGLETGDVLPRSLSRLSSVFLDGIANDLQGRISLDRWRDAQSIPLEATSKQLTAFTNPALYFPAGYVGSSSGVFLGRILGLPPLGIFFLGRLGNYLLASIIFLFAIRSAPAWGWLLLAWYAAPTHMFLRSSFSPDAILNSTVALFLAKSWEISSGRLESPRRLEWGLFMGAGLFVSIFKQAYLPIVVAGLARLPDKRAAKRNLIVALLCIGFVGALASFVWSRACAGFYSSMIVGNDPRDQLAYIAVHPTRTILLVAENFAQFWPEYIRTMIGVIGWLDAYLPHAFVIAFSVFLVFVCMAQTESSRLSLGARLITGSVMIATSFTIAFGVYITGMPVGSDYLLGLQGRYFLPVLLLAMFTFSNSAAARIAEKIVPYLVAGFSAMSMIAIVWTVYQRYYSEL